MLPKDAARYVVNSVILLSSDLKTEVSVLRNENKKLKKECEDLRILASMLKTDDRYGCTCFAEGCNNWWMESDDTDDIPNNPPHFCCESCSEFRYCEAHRNLLKPHNGELWCDHCIRDNE